MDGDYYECVKISYKTLNVFEEMYNNKKEEIMKIIINNIKEKYNIDINTMELLYNNTSDNNKFLVDPTNNIRQIF